MTNYEECDKKLQSLISTHAEVSSIVKSLKTEKTTDEMDFIQARLENYQSFVVGSVRMESVYHPDEKTRIIYRAEGILSSIWDGIIKVINYILRIIDSTIYHARDFVFGKPTGLSNVDKIANFKKNVKAGFNYKVPSSSPLQNILVKQGANDPSDKTAKMIHLAIKISVDTFVNGTDLDALKEAFKNMNKGETVFSKEMLKRQKLMEKKVDDTINYGLDRNQYNSTICARVSARSVLYFENDDTEKSISSYTAPADLFPKEEFEASGVAILKSIDLVEGVTKSLDKLVNFQQKETKTFLSGFESYVKQRKKENATAEEIKGIREILAISKNMATIIDKYQNTFQPLRNFVWLDSLGVI